MSGLTASQALAYLRLIDSAVASVVATAPAAVERLGGPRFVRSRLRVGSPALGPVPALDAEEWAQLAVEHAERGPYS
ncbi:hypothetical protein [Pseudomonas oryzihabitans]|uniref:hypothetical protein n=1 Tax=Pseudomonas oryzihabitans TaxID=47885 RepID=UPI00111F5062|nr:hypothetical protein [Pseudomonas psychrotolerans]QDD90360.1 hypothetical protein CCZ28_15575 [Pseudomonas psychrotolerans]